MHRYRVTWTFTDGTTLVRRYISPITEDAAMTPSFYRNVFRGAGLHQRSTSEHEHMDRFPVPVSAFVKDLG